MDHDAASEPSRRRVRQLWDQLAATPWRDFYIASHSGWNDPAAWRAQAIADLGHFLTGLGSRWLGQQHVLEIGSGVGRLAETLALVGRSYTGVDISAGMLAEAQRRCGNVVGVRFLLGNGSDLPALARDRRYGLILAVAVFIHCPRDLIEATVRSAWSALAPGGTFRLQLRVDADDADAPLLDPRRVSLAADANDPPVLSLAPGTTVPDGRPDSVPAEAVALTTNHDYGGHPFRVREAATALALWAPGATVAMHRPERHLLYAVLTQTSIARSTEA